MMETSTRSARNRRVVAILGWGVLVGTAIILWNGRIQSTIRAVQYVPVAFILAAFAAFVGVFAWLLFNPGRRSASESPVLFFAAGATLFPPPIIGFCLMPVDSPLRGWLAVFIFLLCVIAILSHVPDDFFGVPRGRNTYLTPLPTFDAVDDAIMNPDAAWFNFEDLGRILPDTERPSLAPRSYLQQDQGRPPALAVRGTEKVATEVDDILGSDFDLGLLDDDFNDYDRSPSQRPRTDRRTLSRQQAQSTATARQTNNPPRERRSKDTGSSSQPVRSESTQSADESVFSSFSQTRKTGTQRQPQRYEIASAAIAGRAPSVATRQRRFARHGHQPTRTTADQIRQQIEAKPNRSVTRRTGRGLAAFGGQNVLNPTSESQQPPLIGRDLNRSKQTNQSTDDQDLDYGNLDVHRGQQPRTGSTRESRYSDRKTETTRQEDRRQQTRREQESDQDRSGSSRVSRYEKRTQQVEQRSAEQAQQKQGTKSDDRKLVRKSPPHDKESVETPPKRRSALDIATAGIMGAGMGSAAKESTPDTLDHSDQDAAASQGLFGSVRELFSRPRKPESSEATGTESTGAEEFESAVESVQARSATSNRSQAADLSIERTVDSSGAEMVEGIAVVRFERGQKKVNVHIPFSPPLKGTPEVEVESVNGEQIRLKVPMAQPYGMRIEARRSDTSDELEAEVGFAAMAEEET